MKAADGTVHPQPLHPPQGVRTNRYPLYLFVDLRLGHLVEVLQVRVEEVAADELHPQHGLDDVADGAVVGQADLLRGAHEVAPAAGRQRGAAEEQSPGDVGTLRGLGLAGGGPALIKSQLGGTEVLPSLFPSLLQAPPARQREQGGGTRSNVHPQRCRRSVPRDKSPRESNANALTWPTGSSSVPAPG